MEHDTAADSAGGIGPFTASGHGFLAQLGDSYEQFDMEELLDGFTQSYTGGAEGMGGGMGFSNQQFFDDDAGLDMGLPALEALVPIDVDNAGGLLPPDPYPARNVAGMASFLQQGFGPMDDDEDISNAGLPQLVPYPAVAGDITGPTAAAVSEFPPQQAFTSPDDNAALPLLVAYYPAGEINDPSTAIFYTGIARSGFSWLECNDPPPPAEIPVEDVAASSAAGLFVLAAGMGVITRLEEVQEEDAPLPRFGGLNSDQVCLSILGAFRRALDEEEQQLQRQDAHQQMELSK